MTEEGINSFEPEPAPSIHGESQDMMAGNSIKPKFEASGLAWKSLLTWNKSTS